MEFCGESQPSIISTPSHATAGTITDLTHLIPLDFTYVVYDSTTSHSIILAYLTFLPIVLGLVLFNSFLLRRDLESAFQSCGLVFSTAINTILKRIVAQPRPVGSVKLGHGWPSDHAQFSFFFVTYFSFWLIYRSRMAPIVRLLIIVTIFPTAVIVCWSRYHLGVHSLEQLLAGGCVGIGLGAIWGLAGRLFVWRYIYPRLQDSKLGAMFGLKDLHQLPKGYKSANEFEYEIYREAMRKNRSAPTSPVPPNTTAGNKKEL